MHESIYPYIVGPSSGIIVTRIKQSGALLNRVRGGGIAQVSVLVWAVTSRHSRKIASHVASGEVESWIEAMPYINGDSENDRRHVSACVIIIIIDIFKVA